MITLRATQRISIKQYVNISTGISPTIQSSIDVLNKKIASRTTYRKSGLVNSIKQSPGGDTLITFTVSPPAGEIACINNRLVVSR